MPSTAYRYYTLILANGLLAAGKELPDNSKRRPDQMVRNVVTALGYPEDTELSWASLLEDLKRERLDAFAHHLVTKSYWPKLVQLIAWPPDARLYTPYDPLGPMLGAEAAFADAVSHLAERNVLFPGDDLATARYGLDDWTIATLVDRIGPEDPQLALRLLQATRSGRARFDEHPLAAPYLAAAGFRFYEAVTGSALILRTPGARKAKGRSVREVREEIRTANPHLAENLDRLLATAPSYLGYHKASATFRNQHLRHEPKQDGNPLKVVRDKLAKGLDGALRTALLGGPSVDTDPALALAYAFALPGGSALSEMLQVTIEERMDVPGTDTRFPSAYAMLDWLYGNPDAGSGSPPVELANFARPERLALADSRMVAMRFVGEIMDESQQAVESFLRRADEDDTTRDADVQLAAAYRDAVLELLDGLDDGDPSGSVEHVTPGVARRLWAAATHRRAVRRALDSASFRARIEHASAVAGMKPDDHWRLVRQRLEDSGSVLSLDFTDATDEAGRPPRPAEHPFADASIALDPEADLFDSFRDRVERIEERRSTVLASTSETLLRAIGRWIDEEVTPETPAIADARTRLFFFDALLAAARHDAGPVPLRSDPVDPSTWSDGGRPEQLLADHFAVLRPRSGDELASLAYDAPEAEASRRVLHALADFLDVVAQLELTLQDEIERSSDWMGS